MMRRILLNHARDRAAGKRGGKAERVSLSEVDGSAKIKDMELIALDNALKQLEEMDPRKSKIVEMKFFGGLTNEEIAEILQISIATVKREWALSRAWLFRWVKGQ